MKKFSVILMAAAVLVTLASPALALDAKVMTRTNGTAGFAVWSEMDGDVFNDTFLQAVETNMGTEVFVAQCWFNVVTEEGSCKDGYRMTSDDVFSVSKKLTSATLMPVDVEVYDWMTDTFETVTVSATWNGTGDLERGSLHVRERFGDTSFRYSERSTFRAGESVAMWNATDLGPSMDAGLVQFRSMNVFMDR
ncbi:MAG: hypothetical protein HY341_00655 [Candidatus Kerfeldbacteria bacterium]|nr:hypothetical protein [Candidatus Kerfeldbacteria bacterium]